MYNVVGNQNIKNHTPNKLLIIGVAFGVHHYVVLASQSSSTEADKYSPALGDRFNLVFIQQCMCISITSMIDATRTHSAMLYKDVQNIFTKSPHIFRLPAIKSAVK